jgi:hypothetical protein
MPPKYIFCQCMKPWKLCINKKVSHKIDARGLIDVYRLRDPFYSDYKRDQLRDSCYNSSNNINYDFINMRATNTEFECRFFKPPL